MRAQRAGSFCRLTLLVSVALPVLAGPLRAQDPPYTVNQLIRLIQSRVFTEDVILQRTRESCLGFRMDEAAENSLRSAGATDLLITGLRDICVALPYGVESIRLLPDSLELEMGSVGELDARPLDGDGVVVSGVPLEWVSSDTSIADVFGHGVVVGKQIGEATIAARTEGGIEGTMRLVVVEADTTTQIVTITTKSVGTAAVLGTIIPGGGEFYTGSTTKGVIVLAGTAAAVGAAFLLASEDTVPLEPRLLETCVDTSCTLQIADVVEVQSQGAVTGGLVVAAAFWAYGLVDGIRRAVKSKNVQPQPQFENDDGGLSILLLPSDGVRVSRRGELDLTLVRVQ